MLSSAKAGPGTKPESIKPLSAAARSSFSRRPASITTRSIRPRKAAGNCSRSFSRRALSCHCFERIASVPCLNDCPNRCQIASKVRNDLNEVEIRRERRGVGLISILLGPSPKWASEIAPSPKRNSKSILCETIPNPRSSIPDPSPEKSNGFKRKRGQLPDA